MSRDYATQHWLQAQPSPRPSPERPGRAPNPSPQSLPLASICRLPLRPKPRPPSASTAPAPLGCQGSDCHSDGGGSFSHEYLSGDLSPSVAGRASGWRGPGQGRRRLTGLIRPAEALGWAGDRKAMVSGAVRGAEPAAGPVAAARCPRSSVDPGSAGRGRSNRSRRRHGAFRVEQGACRAEDRQRLLRDRSCEAPLPRRGP